MNIEAPPELLKDDPALGIWPENWHALGLFVRLGTQWRYAQKRIGMGLSINLPTGLDYGRLEFWLELDRVPKPEWPAAVDGMQVMELEWRRLAARG